MDMTTAGSTIKRARIAAGLTLRDLAKRVDLHHQTIANIEAGKTTTTSTLAQVAEALGLQVGVAIIDPADVRAAVRARFERVLPLIPEDDLSPFLAQLALWERKYGPGEAGS